MKNFYLKRAESLQSIIFKLTVIFSFTAALFLTGTAVNGQSTDGVATYMNPVLPGSHPDQTLLKVGNDFYTAGSSFHWTPNFPILHSTDLVHWEVVSNVVSPTWSGLVGQDAPKDGTWQGALAYFDNKYWAFFFIHGGGQYFSNASNPRGPWSTPTLIRNSIGYDNAVFVDDDGRAYMMMKNGQDLNRIQELGRDGQLTGSVMNMDWVNRDHRFSWAEGPKMCKRNGRYYYFVAGNVYGGQYVLSSPTLTANESSWTIHGNFFRGTGTGGFTGPNHITNPVQISDGTWWCLAHSYHNNGWEGQGRQSMLFQVHWDANGIPYANNPNGGPLTAPKLPSNGKNYKYVKSDFFTTATRNPHWHFHNTANVQKASLTARPGYLRLTPGSGTTHILQRDPAKQYTLVTKVEINATSNGQQAGLRLMNGEDLVYARLYSGYNNGKKIGLSFNGVTTEVNNTIGNTVWLKVERVQHNISGFYSSDGTTWTKVGNTISIADLDKQQTNDNAWVGTSTGLYATAQTADFDHFSYMYGFDPIRLAAYNNYSGTSIATATPGQVVTNSADGSWCMLAGVTMEKEGQGSNIIEVNAASANSSGSLEVWIDNIGTAGTKIATIPITSSGGADVWKNYTAPVSVSGQHDLYFRFIGPANVFRLNTVKFISNGGPIVSFTSPADNATFTAGATVTLTATASDQGGNVSNVSFYNGTTLLGTDNTSPYSFEWTNVPAGTHTLRALATDNQGNKGEATITIKVTLPQGPYGGTVHVIPGTIQAEAFDVGGNGFAYSDNTPGSETGVAFRTDEDVDIETCTDAGGGYNIGWATAGEWLEYTVNVQTTGTYHLDLRVACNGEDRTVTVSMDGSNIASSVAIPNTTGWQTWQTVRVSNIALTAGQKIMRITVGATDYININYVTYVLAQPPTVAITAAGPVTFCTGGSVVLNATTGTGYTYQWKKDGSDISNATTSSYTATQSGSYTVTVTSGGQTATSAAVNVTANPLPSAVITPSGPTTFVEGGSVELTANTGAGLTYKWLRSGTEVGTGMSYTATLSGSYAVEVSNASACKATSAPVNVTVSANQPSVVTLVSPAPNSTVSGPITITVVVSDPDGGITLVEYLDGTTVIGTSTESPYNFTWTNPATGEHVITVRVTDSNGGVTVSSPVTVTSDAVTGLHGITEMEGVIYPNPAKGEITIETATDLSNAKVTAINVLGEEIQLGMMQNGRGAIADVSNLTEGTYLLIVRKDNTILKKKITVVK